MIQKGINTIKIQKSDIDDFLEYSRQIIAYYEALLEGKTNLQIPKVLVDISNYESLNEEEKARIERLSYIAGVDIAELSKQERKKRTAFQTGIASAGLGIAGAAMSGVSLPGAGVTTASLIGGTVGLIAPAVAFPPLAAVVVPAALALGTFSALRPSSAVQKYLNEKKPEIDASLNLIHLLQEKAELISQDLQKKDYEQGIKLTEKFKSIENNYAERTKQIQEEYRKAAKELARKVQVTADDLTHQNVNKRIQTYQAIVLKQYENQIQFEKDVYELSVLYNKTLQENSELRNKNLQMQRIIDGTQILKNGMNRLSAEE